MLYKQTDQSTSRATVTEVLKKIMQKRALLTMQYCQKCIITVYIVSAAQDKSDFLFWSSKREPSVRYNTEWERTN